MNIDEIVELDLTFAQLAERKAEKAFVAGCWFGWEAGIDGAILKGKIEEAWKDYKNGK